MRFTRKGALVGAMLLPVAAGGFLLQARGTRESAQLLDQVMSLVAERFVDTVGTAALYEKAARGVVRELNDPYSELLTPRELRSFTTNTGGRYGGIGMQIEQQDGNVVISRVFPNTPAEAAGVREGDRIIQVDSLMTRGWTTQRMSDYLTGTPGTRVTVRFSRPGVATPIEYRFTRAVIHVPAVQYSMLFDQAGYVPLLRFNETSAQEVENAVRELQRRGARSIILDMRGNPGGILDQSLAISNIFLPRGQSLLTVRARGGQSHTYQARNAPAAPTIPVVVLTDEYSASASEIVAGALQDHDRALIIGETTFGKGLVQSVFNLDGGYALKLTTAKWYTPSGRSIQRERRVENGRFVEDAPDTNETEAERRERPAFRSDAGRVVYGGGGIAPDLLVRDDTLTTAEQQFNRAIAPKNQEVYVALADYAIELSRGLRPDFQVQQAWIDTFYDRIRARGVEVDRAQYDQARRYVARLLEQRVARTAFGDSAAKRRDVPFDAPLRRALDMLERARTQADLFTMATAATTVTRSTPAPARP